MIVRLKHADGHQMAFECRAFNMNEDGTIVNFVSPTGKELDWDAAALRPIAEMTVHYDSGVLLQQIKGPKMFGGAQGSGHSSAGMGG